MALDSSGGSVKLAANHAEVEMVVAEMGSVVDEIVARGGLFSVASAKMGIDQLKTAVYKPPWYIEYKWPLIIGGIAAVGVAAYAIAK